MPTTYYETYNGRIRGESTTGVETTYLTDALGSVVATVDSTEAVKNTYRHKPYGELLAKTGTDIDPKFLWTGDTGSRTTGNTYAEQYNRARHYGSKQASWTTADSMWPDEQAYGYVTGNSVNFIDPFGLQKKRPPSKKATDCKNAKGSCKGTDLSKCRFKNKQGKDVGPSYPGSSWAFPCAEKLSSLMTRFCGGSPSINEDVVTCMIWAESSGNPGATQPGNEDGTPFGLMQLKYPDVRLDDRYCRSTHGCKPGGVPQPDGSSRPFGDFKRSSACDQLELGVYALCKCKYGGRVSPTWPTQTSGQSWGTVTRKNSPFCCCMCSKGS